MREIKFRAWDNVHHKYFEPMYKAYEGRLEYLQLGMDGRLARVVLDSARNIEIQDESIFPGVYTIEQYTGLKDKNGTEIYEGDVVTWLSRNFGKVFGTAEEDEPEWIEEIRQIKYRKQEFNVPQGTIRELKVIGNIHEDPELLERMG